MKHKANESMKKQKTQESITNLHGQPGKPSQYKKCIRHLNTLQKNR